MRSRTESNQIDFPTIWRSLGSDFSVPDRRPLQFTYMCDS